MRVAALASVLALTVAASDARAQIVVNPNIGERVDYPYARRGDGYNYIGPRRGRPARFFVTQSAFPTPQTWGWFTCCN